MRGINHLHGFVSLANSVIFHFQNCWLKRKLSARPTPCLSNNWHIVNCWTMKKFIVFAVTMVPSYLYISCHISLDVRETQGLSRYPWKSKNTISLFLFFFKILKSEAKRSFSVLVYKCKYPDMEMRWLYCFMLPITVISLIDSWSLKWLVSVLLVCLIRAATAVVSILQPLPGSFLSVSWLYQSPLL